MFRSMFMHTRAQWDEKVLHLYLFSDLVLLVLFIHCLILGFDSIFVQIPFSDDYLFYFIISVVTPWKCDLTENGANMLHGGFWTFSFSFNKCCCCCCLSWVRSVRWVHVVKSVWFFLLNVNDGPFSTSTFTWMECYRFNYL